MTPTAARTTNEQSCHWYHKDGRACYEVPRASGEGVRSTTLADARKLGLLPSVTTVLSILAKPQLTNWLIEQACLAVLTTPQMQDEPTDAFVRRVLHEERQQDQERDIAAKRGTEIHDAIEGYFCHGLPAPGDEIWPWIEPVIDFLEMFGYVKHCEHILVSSDGYAGRSDLIQENSKGVRIWDFKSTKKLPTKGAWTEHVLQLSAYANAFPRSPAVEITCGNIYISTLEPGKFVVCEHKEHWGDTYEMGFKPLLHHWMWSANYHP